MTAMTAEQVAGFLKAHPEFFDQYADLLALITIPDPHSGRAISITERQLFTLREKVRSLETKMSELISFGGENDAISDKVHALGLALISALGVAAVTRVVYSHLGGAFAVPHVALRIWDTGDGSEASGVEFDPVTDAAKAFASGLTRPSCGLAGTHESLAWFGTAAPSLRSLAQVPLHHANGNCFGLLVMGSEDQHRFYPELGTLYIERIGAMVSNALLRVLL
jgi:uncharacterized protein YigA (DUF484 family)